MNDRTSQAETAARFRRARGYVFDLDGSLVMGDKRNNSVAALPGAAEMLSFLDTKDIPYLVLTNGTVRTPVGIAGELAKAGLVVPAERIMTPSTVAADYFVRRGARRVLVFGGEGVWQPIADAGIEVVVSGSGDDARHVDAIFIGWYRSIHMDEVEVACEAVWAGAGLFAASMVPFFATRHGRALGSSRAIAAMITSITGRRATALGKPSQHALRDAASHIGCKTSDLVVVGDDPDLEVHMALNGGALAVGLHTGIAGAAEYAALETRRQPHLSLPGVGDLLRYLADLV